MPFGIEHEDRVVAHALDEQAEALLALAEVFYAAAGDVHDIVHRRPWSMFGSGWR